MKVATPKQCHGSAMVSEGAETPEKMTLSTGRKRKFDARSPDEIENSLYPMFSPSLSLGKLARSPSSSPTKRRANLVIKQGANQNNKILRYLQPKRLLESFVNQGTTSVFVPVQSPTNNDKENKILDLKVHLVRIDDNKYQKQSCGTLLRSPKKFCCNAALGFSVQALENIVLKDAEDLCKRLGISVPKCISAGGCCHKKLADSCSSHQALLYSTMIDVDLEVMMIRACCLDLSTKSYPSPAVFRAIFNIMKESADKKTIDLGRSYLKRVVANFPPCNPRLRLYYLIVLHTGDLKVNMCGLWSLRTLEFFDEILTEVENLIEGLLNPKQLKDKLKTPGIRQIRRPKRYCESPSPKEKGSHDICLKVVEDMTKDFNNISDEAMKKKKLRDEAVLAMPAREKTDHVFSRFEILVDILEWDLVVWLSENVDYSKIRDRVVSPLIVLALWRPESDIGFDSVHCRRIFSMYVSAWVLEFNPRHLRTLGRLIGMIAEVTKASEPNHGNVHPHTGDGCANLSRKLCDALKNTQMEELRVKAVQMLKPDWLQMQVSANLLSISPTISSVDMETILQPMSDSTMCLWAIFLEVVMEIHHVKEAMRLLKQASEGYFEDEFLQKNPADTSSHQINYKAILREISGFYNLSRQISRSINRDHVPELLLQILTK